MKRSIMAKQPRASDDDKPATLKIDILGMELERKSPHCLSPIHRLDANRRQAIRDKHRARYLVSKKKPGRSSTQ